MRTLTLGLLLSSAVALAQHENGGVWTGYVGGWKPNTQSVAVHPLALQARQRWVPPVVVVPWAMNTVATARQDQELAAQQAAEHRRAWDAEQARITQQTQLENERRLAAERQAYLQQQLEQERRLAAEREALVVARARLEQEAEARRLAAAQPPPPPEPPRPPPPSTPGNDIYRWTDADGVVHYTTNVPAEAKPFAKKVGQR